MNTINHTRVLHSNSYSASSTMASSKSSEIASAINSLLHMDQADQDSLLEVIEEYFTLPSSRREEVDSDSNIEESESGKNNNKIHNASTT